MKSLSLVAILFCSTGCLWAQDVASQQAPGLPPSTPVPVAAEFPRPTFTLSAESAGVPSSAAALFAGLSPSSAPSPAGSTATPNAAPADPKPAAPEPRFVYGGRDDFRWQLALGVSLVRFRSSQIYATGVGTDTSITYFTNEWLGFEGRFTTSFAPTILRAEHVKFLGYGGGPKISWRAQKFEPFVHVLAGGMHLRPQFAAGSANGAEFQFGGGAGYRFNPRLSARVVVDYMRSHMFSQWQNDAEASLQAVLHF